jgi:hypothetical protein
LQSLNVCHIQIEKCDRFVKVAMGFKADGRARKSGIFFYIWICVSKITLEATFGDGI